MNDTLNVLFYHNLGVDNSLGRKEAMLILGLMNDIESDLDTNLYILDTFFLIGKITELAIDGYDDFINFDSVFVNQNIPIKKEWRVKNTINFPVNANNLTLQTTSQIMEKEEFFIDENDFPEFPLAFFPGNNFVYQSLFFSYQPVDINNDTALVELHFQPDPETNPSKIDTAKVKLFGTAVKHSLEISEINCPDCQIIKDDFSENFDTIDVGKINVNEEKSIKIKLRNVGNINFGMKNQNILGENSNLPVDFFQIKKYFGQPENPNYELGINEEDSLEITFIPDRKGNFIARLIIENNFKERKILSNNFEDYRQVIYLKGVGTEPIIEIGLENETKNIDFGSVSFAKTCETEIDTTIKIFNTGNATLIISNIYTENATNFSVNPTDLMILPNSEAEIVVTFISGFSEKIHAEKLHIISNCRQNNDISIDLKAASIPPISAEMSIPNLSNKPGTLLQIPIILTNQVAENVSSYGNSYSFDLSFNPTLLTFDKYITLNTASSGRLIEVEQKNPNTINVHIEAGRDFPNFLNNKILLYLDFHTFIGNDFASELAISNAKIGNNNCDDFMDLTLKNGIYSIDSICGLEYKLNSLSNLKYDFSLKNTEITTNFCSINFTLPFSTDAKIEIFNSNGEKFISENYNLPFGSFSKSIDLNNLTKNVYYCVFSSGLFRKTIPFIYK
jgi:hypothetical protein